MTNTLPERDKEKACEGCGRLQDMKKRIDALETVAWFCDDESTLSFAEMRGCSCIPLYDLRGIKE